MFFINFLMMVLLAGLVVTYLFWQRYVDALGCALLFCSYLAHGLFALALSLAGLALVLVGLYLFVRKGANRTPDAKRQENTRE